MNIKSTAWFLLGSVCALIGALPLIHLLGDLWQLTNIVFVDFWASGEWFPALRRLDYGNMAGAAIVGALFMLAATKSWQRMHVASLQEPRFQPIEYFFRFLDWGSSRMAVEGMADGRYLTGVALVTLLMLFVGWCGDYLSWNLGVGCAIWFVSCLTAVRIAKLHAPKNSTQPIEGK
jgi:hypothetical protein